MSKTNSYYESDRKELLELVPLNAIKILDVGCASGNFGQLIKKRQDCEIYGIELNHQAAAKAKEKLDKVYTEKIENCFEKFSDNYFDCIILADIIEHLQNPSFVLLKLIQKLNSKGLFIISIPNFWHYDVIEKLINGNFAYSEDGILDNTHISFFTKSSLIQLLLNSNLRIKEFNTASVFRDINNEILKPFVENGIVINNLLEEINIFQYIITARINQQVVKPENLLISIILIIKEESYDSSIIQNLTKDLTTKYQLIILCHDSFKLNENIPDARIINFTNNISETLNRGILASSGNYLLLIDGNCHLSKNWDLLMTQKFNCFENTGIVVPLINQTDILKQKITQDIEKSENYTNIFELNRIDNSCMMINRDLIGQIGGFDINLADLYTEDFVLRARLNKFRILLTRDTFINKSVSKPDSNYNEQFLYFKDKWQLNGIQNIKTELNIKDIHLSEEEKDESLFFSLTEKADKTVLLDKFNASIKTNDYKNLIHELHFFIKKSENLFAEYLLVLVYIISQEYHQGLQKLNELLKKDGPNKDNCLMLSIILNKLNDQKMSLFFKDKSINTTKLSDWHEDLIGYIRDFINPNQE